MKTRALFTLNLSDAFYTNTLNHPNQSSSWADLNTTALIVLVSSLCQPSLGTVFLNVLSQGNFMTTHIHTHTSAHTHNDFNGTPGWTAQRIYCSHFAVISELRKPHSLISKTGQHKASVSIQYQCPINIRRVKTNNVCTAPPVSLSPHPVTNALAAEEDDSCAAHLFSRGSRV